MNALRREWLGLPYSSRCTVTSALHVNTATARRCKDMQDGIYGTPLDAAGPSCENAATI
jgi:hypothetical protein